MRDKVTQREIAIVGTVHYNPASVSRARSEVGLAMERNGRLGAVVVESCLSRWQRSLELAPPGSLTASLICSEMQGAAGEALQYGVPVMLGDADAGPFLERVKALARQSVRELFNPIGGGWQAIAADFARTLPPTLFPTDVAQSELLLDGEAPLSLTDYLRPDVAIGFLASLVRYPLAFALKAPVPFFVFAAAILTLDVTASTLDGMAVASADAGEAISPSIAVAASAFALGELGLVVVTARLLLVAFLEERNAEIARSIRRAAAECDAPVVAILGGLHVNGVARLLMSDETPDADQLAYGRTADGVWWDVPADIDVKQWAS